MDAFLRSSIFASYYEGFDINVNTLLESVQGNIGKFFTDTVGGIASGVTSFISALTGFILAIVTVPFILFYLLKDGEKLPQLIVKMLPPRMREDAEIIFRDADHQISSYIQGQILVAICIGIMVSIGFLIIGMKYALLLGRPGDVYKCCSVSRSSYRDYTSGNYCDCHIPINACSNWRLYGRLFN